MDIFAAVGAPQANDRGGEGVPPTHRAEARVPNEHGERGTDVLLDDEAARPEGPPRAARQTVRRAGRVRRSRHPVGPALLSSTHWPAKAPGLRKSGKHSCGDRGASRTICTGAVVPATTTGTACREKPVDKAR